MGSVRGGVSGAVPQRSVLCSELFFCQLGGFAEANKDRDNARRQRAEHHERPLVDLVYPRIFLVEQGIRKITIHDSNIAYAT